MRLQGLRPVAATGHRDRSLVWTAPLSTHHRATGFAAQELHSQENWHPRLADCFQFFETGGERLLATKLEVSFNTFRWASC